MIPLHCETLTPHDKVMTVMRRYLLVFALVSSIMTIGCGDDGDAPPITSLIIEPEVVASDATDDTQDPTPDTTDSTGTDTGPEDISDGGGTDGGGSDATEPFDCDSVSEDALCDAVDSTRCAPEQAGLVQVCADMGGCSVWSDGESCLEENLCTNAPDVCLDGACVADGDPNAECAGSDDPCMDVACDPATGICTTELKEENSSCDDGLACTTNDICFQGECGGNYDCPKECAIQSQLVDPAAEAKGVVIITTLSAGEKSSNISTYGCSEAAGHDYEGFEKAYQWKALDGAPCSGKVYVELMSPDDAGSKYVDAFILEGAGYCDLDACGAAAMMDDYGRAMLDFTLDSGADPVKIVIDGRDGYAGEVRLSISCDPFYTTEGLCTDGLDGPDGDGSSDCSDIDCASAPICQIESANCGDNIDNDGDGAKDCDDPDCADDPSCDMGNVCSFAAPLTCGDSISGQSVLDGDNYVSLVNLSDNCPGETVPGPSSDYFSEQQMYAVDAGDADCFELKVLSSDPMSGFFDYMFLPSCTNALGCISGFSDIFDEVDDTMKIQNTASGYLSVLQLSFGGALEPVPYTIEMDCSCSD